MNTTDFVLNAPPDRLHYATGELLGADDFKLEQAYHRRQLARTLLFLHGRGCVAGLEVSVKPELDKAGQFVEAHLEVAPGLAIDGVGRLIEVPRHACLRLKRWFNYIASQTASPKPGVMELAKLRGARRDDANFAGGGAVVADVFLTFHACNRGYTPTFASGPFDALDASQPSRVRDAYELSLVLRPRTDDLKSAFDPWSSIQGDTAEKRMASTRAASLAMWDTLNKLAGDDPALAQEIPAGVDRAAVLLARVRIPAAPQADEAKPPGAVWTSAAWAEPKIIDNTVRNLVLPAAAWRRVLAT